MKPNRSLTIKMHESGMRKLIRDLFASCECKGDVFTPKWPITSLATWQAGVRANHRAIKPR